MYPACILVSQCSVISKKTKERAVNVHTSFFLQPIFSDDPCRKPSSTLARQEAGSARLFTAVLFTAVLVCAAT
jgi:hypothetical protein